MADYLIEDYVPAAADMREAEEEQST